MVCYKCRFEYDESVFLEMEKIALAFFPPEVLSQERWRTLTWGDPAFGSQFGTFLFKRLQSDDTFISRYREMQGSVYQAKPKCPNCGEPLYNDRLSHIESSAHSTLVEQQLTFMIDEFTRLHKKDPSGLLVHLETTWKKIYFLIENVDGFYGGRAKYIREVHDFVRSLEHPGRGGDGDWAIVQWVYDFATNEFVKSAVYDLIKFTGSSILAYFLAKRHLRKVQAQSEKKIEENFEGSLSRTDEYTPSRMLKYLTKRERKKLSRKLGKRIAKEQFEKVRKSKV